MLLISAVGVDVPNSWVPAPANSAMPEGCAQMKMLLTREEGHSGHLAQGESSGAFPFQHLMPALQQQGLLPNEVCTVAKTAGSVPQAAKQHGWNSAEGSCTAKPERHSAQGRTHCGPTWHGLCWWQQVGTGTGDMAPSVRRALLEVIIQSSAQCQTSMEAEMPWALFTHLKRINFAFRCNVSPST